MDWNRRIHVSSARMRRTMVTVVVVVFACILGVALMGPFLYTFVCQVRGC